MNAGVVSLAAIKIACASEVCRQTEVPFGRALDLVQLHFPKGSSDVPGSFAEVDLARDNGLLAPEIYKQVMAVFYSRMK